LRTDDTTVIDKANGYLPEGRTRGADLDPVDHLHFGTAHRFQSLCEQFQGSISDSVLFNHGLSLLNSYWNPWTHGPEYSVLKKAMQKKPTECAEGFEARHNFEKAIEALFRVPKKSKKATIRPLYTGRAPASS
jgi:hypothetical protein